MKACNEKSERMAIFHEAIELDMDNATKSLLDGAERLSWCSSELSAETIDRWIETINSALYKLKRERMQRVRTVRA